MKELFIPFGFVCIGIGLVTNNTVMCIVGGIMIVHGLYQIGKEVE